MPVVFATVSAVPGFPSNALKTPWFAAAPRMLLAQPPVMICMTFSGVGPVIESSDTNFRRQSISEDPGDMSSSSLTVDLTHWYDLEAGKWCYALNSSRLFFGNDWR
jgi:hypothetical protein